MFWQVYKYPAQNVLQIMVLGHLWRVLATPLCKYPAKKALQIMVLGHVSGVLAPPLCNRALNHCE